MILLTGRVQLLIKITATKKKFELTYHRGSLDARDEKCLHKKFLTNIAPRIFPNYIIM